MTLSPGQAMANEIGSEAQRQQLRRRRAFVALAGCVVFLLVAWIARGLGLVALGPVGFWVLFGPWLAGAAALVAFVASGRNLGLRDPSLTLAQILWAAVGPILLYPFVPALGELSHLGLLTIGLFGAFRLSNTRYVITNLSLAAGLGVALLVRRRSGPTVWTSGPR